LKYTYAVVLHFKIVGSVKTDTCNTMVRSVGNEEWKRNVVHNVFNNLVFG